MSNNLTPNDFSREIDWSVDTFDDTIMPSGTLFRPSNDRYEYDDGFVVHLNSEGRTIRLRTADRGDVDLNFKQDSPILVAENPDNADDFDDAAIRISFSSPVRAVGAYVSCYRKGQSTQNRQDAFIAVMKVRRGGQTETFLLPGVNGPTPSDGEEGSAPFICASSAQQDIDGVSFDVATTGNRAMDYVAISNLHLIQG